MFQYQQKPTISTIDGALDSIFLPYLNLIKLNFRGKIETI